MRNRLPTLAALLWFSAVALASAKADEPLRPRAAAIVLAVHDGDTIRADVHLGYGVWLRDQSIRLSGYDAPEITRTRKTVDISAAELRRGKEAREVLVELLTSGDVWLEQAGDGKSVYGRLECFAYVRTKTELIDVAAEMKRRGAIR